MFFSTKKYYTTLILIAFLIVQQSTSGQCPDGIYFSKRISTIYNSQEIKPERQLIELLKLRQKMKMCHSGTDSSFMYLNQKIGALYYTAKLNYDSAIYFTNISIIIAKKLLQNKKAPSLPLVDNYYALFVFFNDLNKDKEKFMAADSCIAYFLKGGNAYQKVLAVLSYRIEYFFNKGDYILSNNNAKFGEEIVRKNYRNADSAAYAIFFAGSRANSLYYGNEIPLALELSENTIAQFEHTTYSDQLGPFYSLLGIINSDERKYLKALSFFRKGFEKSTLVKDDKGCSQNLAFIGTITGTKLKRYDEGLKYLSTSLKYADAIDSLNVFRQKGNIYSLKNRFDSAQYFFKKGYNSVQSGMDENTLLQKLFQFPGFNELQNLSDLTTDKGDAYVRQYHFTGNKSFLKNAINVYKKNDLFLNKIRTEQNLQFASSLVWNKTARSLYEHAIDACYADNNIEDAFYFFEKSRAVLLNDQVNKQRWKADADILNEGKLKKAIIELEQKIDEIPDSSEENMMLQKKLYVANQQYNLFINSFKSRNPLYYQKYIDTSFLSIIQLRKDILKDNKRLVEIFSGDSSVFILTITGTDQLLKKIDKKLYEDLAILFNTYISNPGLLNKDFKGWVKTSHQLYALVFQNKVIPDGRIIISPDGINYPFEALVMSGTHEPDYFLNHYATSYAYSAKYLTNGFAENTNKSTTIFGMAPVKYNKEMHLSPLIGSDHSLNKINNYYSKATNFVFEKATKNSFLQNFPNYTIIQLYTHAADSSGREDPVIFFADSALYLSNLLPDRRPVTQLVVLSACETANGKFYEGEGVFSFNRGFAALGIPAAISNLWSVENESTYRITELFYKYLSKGFPTDVALQKAKLEFINKSDSKEKKLPYYWAGAILTGKADVLGSNHSLPWLKITLAIILLLGIIYLIRKFGFQQKGIQKTQPGNLRW